MKIAYFGFDLFYDCLEQIKNSGHEIIKIFTCKVDEVYEFSNKVRRFAAENNIEITDAKVCKLDIENLIKNKCDLLFSAGYYFKIPIIEGVLGVNIHPALLPVGRGPWPQPVTILKELDETGITLHKLSNNFDEGDIILQKKFKLDFKENLETLTEKNAYYARRVTEELFCDFENLILNSVKQTAGEYWPEPNESDYLFDENDAGEKIDKILRAFYGFKCTMLFKDKKIHIKKGIFTYDHVLSNNDVYEMNDGYVAVIEYA